MVLLPDDDTNDDPEYRLGRSRRDRVNAYTRKLWERLEAATAANQRLEAELAAHAERLGREIPKLQPETAEENPYGTWQGDFHLTDEDRDETGPIAECIADMLNIHQFLFSVWAMKRDTARAQALTTKLEAAMSGLAQAPG